MKQTNPFLLSAALFCLLLTQPIHAATALPSCQTAQEIIDFLFDGNAAGDAHCIHDVLNPETGLGDGAAIAEGDRLPKNLKMAFSHRNMSWAKASVECSKLGSGWSSPLSMGIHADPRAAANTLSAEAVGIYLGGATNIGNGLWTGSSLKGGRVTKWYIELTSGAVDVAPFDKYYFAVCIKQ